MNTTALLEIQEKDLQLVVREKTLGKLVTNAKQIKELVIKALPQYDIINYNEGNIDVAKKDKAMLNNAAKSLNAKRIELEKEFLVPFQEFKEEINETVKLITECSSKIDLVVKQSEQKAKDEKKQKIVSYWNSKNFELVPLERVFDEKWLNKTTKEKDIKADIDSKIEKIKDDIITLEAIGEDVELLKSLYLDTLNINSTIQYANTLKANKEKARIEAEERAKVEAEQKAKAEIEQPTTVEENPFEQPAPQTVVEPVKETIAQPELLTRAIKVTGTKEQIIALADFMNNNGIRFEKIEL